MTLPPGGTLIAGDEQAPQAFSWADVAWAFQFHLEANAPIIADWVAHYQETLARCGIDSTTLLRETRRRGGGYEAMSTAVARAYAQRLKAAASTRAASA